MCFVTAASQEVIKKINGAEKPQGASGGDGLPVDRLSVCVRVCDTKAWHCEGPEEDEVLLWECGGVRMTGGAVSEGVLQSGRAWRLQLERQARDVSVFGLS